MKKVIVCLIVGFWASTVNAGTPVFGVSKDLGEALEKSVAAVEQAASVHGTCVSEYPSLDTCTESKGYWQCQSIRANHKGSCANKPSDLDNVIKAAKGLSGPAAKLGLGAN